MPRPRRFAFLLLTLLALPVAAEPSLEGALVVDGADDARFARIVDALEAAGARLPHRLPPEVAVGTLPAGIESALPRVPGVTLRIERAGGPLLDGPVPRSLGAARAFLRGGREIPGLPPGLTLAGDQVEPLPGEIVATPKALPAGDCAPYPGPSSAYLAGHVAIGILIPESDASSPDTENWANPDTRYPGMDRQDLVVAEIMQGCDTLVAEIPQANLAFSYDVRRSLPVGHEPILETVPGRSIWIDEVLDDIGHGSSASSAGTFGYVQEMRDRFGADWGAAVYVADDLNDADNGFAPTGFPFAYALLGGPYMVMTYDNDGWGLGRMDVVFRHELGHIFHALDEYRSAGNSCANTSGVLSVPNANNDSAPPDSSCVTAVACVMRANDVPDACAFSLGQMGIRDTDGDGIIDTRDAPPDSGFELDNPILVTSADVVLSARASGTPAASERGFVPAFASMNKITGAERWLDGAPWPLAAADGSFGGRCEDLAVSLTGLSEGWHVVQVRATNDVGIVEPTPAEAHVYVNTDCADDGSEPDDDAGSARARAVGTFTAFHCAFDEDWSRFRMQAGATLQLTLTQTVTTGSLRIRLLDPYMTEIAHADAVAGTATINAVATAAGTHHVVVECAAEFETAYQLTLTAACLDDPDEPDALPVAANGMIGQRVLCAGDEDRYLVSVQAGETLSADTAFDATAGDLDLELRDPSDAVVASSTGTGPTEAVSVTPTVEGVYAVRVFGKTATDRGIYDLNITATGCLDDPGENDDDLATARLMGAADVRGVICTTDDDWYAFDVAGRRLVRVLLDHDAGDGNVDLELYTDAGRMVGRSTRPGGSEEISSERLRPGSYRVRVTGTDGARVPYRLRVENEDPILLFVRKDPSDAILGWNLSGQECFTYRRSTNPADFSGAVTEIVNEGDPSVPDGDRPIGDLVKRDRGVIYDGVFLYCYLIDPHDCGASLVGTVKSANPYPVVPPGIGTMPSIEYTIAVNNGGVADENGVTVRDDVPQAAISYTVLEIPPGATDASLPPPAGAYGRGQILITGVDVPAGGERLVRFRIGLSPNSTFDNPIVSNQGYVGTGPTPVDPGREWPTDDGLTSAFEDDTRVFVTGYVRGVTVNAFWHRDVDIDLRVIDPCGNVISEHDMTSATCGTVNAWLRMSSCTVPGFPGRFEQIQFSPWPSPGAYRIEVAYPGSLPGDPACGGAGTDEVTVVYESPAVPYMWRTLTIDPGEPGMPVFTVTE